jgi:hypothetical protein
MDYLDEVLKGTVEGAMMAHGGDLEEPGRARSG